MQQQHLRMGSGALHFPEGEVRGGFVTIDDERFYRIANYDLMADFFMTIVSDADHWMFLSSNGSLTAGRRDRDNALFPYYTDDKIHDYHGLTGSKTVVQCLREDGVWLWEPFSKHLAGHYRTERNIFKSVLGNKVIFEEINLDLGLRFRYGWYNSDRYGFVKQSSLAAAGEQPVRVRLLDGLRNLLPSEIECEFQNAYSNLLDGYKKHELMPESQLGLFMLSAVPIDRAEPSESLRATTVWSRGLNPHAVLLSDRQLDRFGRGVDVSTEWDVKGGRGAYYVVADIELEPGATKRWVMVAEVNQTSLQVSNLRRWLAAEQNAVTAVVEDIKHGTAHLKRLVASADGLQLSNEELTSARHFSNTLFNIMRGGIYLDGYRIDTEDFKQFVRLTNRSVFERHRPLLDTVLGTVSHEHLLTTCEESGSADLKRICFEYLPLTFSRRHGDPSRPWNLFSIVTRNEDGSPISDYQGNWRDIFQNWEALCHAFPGYIEHIICKFLNASTADGYNPYRITKAGLDWERPDPADPWAYIGYWGDHQIIYLQKLLELSAQYHPDRLGALLTEEIFAYANVPYRIRAYSDIVIDPKNTIDFDNKLDARIEERVEHLGSDGRLVQSTHGGVYTVNMTEKILVTSLVKLSNLVPEAGIWLNTQRPEWNDANNALVGNGVSVVTLCYLRRFLDFWLQQWRQQPSMDVRISGEVLDFLTSVESTFEQFAPALAGRIDDEVRRRITDALGTSGSEYRHHVYAHGFTGEKHHLSGEALAKFYALALRFVDHSIAANARDDGLYHAYNLIRFSRNSVSIRPLYEMLEGQVAALSTGHLDAETSLQILDTMKSSGLYREDQFSYLLYPDRELPRFVDKNNLPEEAVATSPLLLQLLADDSQSIVARDDAGIVHFCSDFHNAGHLAAALDALPSETYGDLVAEERGHVLDVYETMFDHQSFTGRSGTFYAYEGLGCIYWHMVSKLLLAVSETYHRVVDDGASPEVLGRIKDHYYEIKAGIGLFKSPALYGAFPTDAYSHSVRDAGVKQPGMTGQVKEDVISRFAELGVSVRRGVLAFEPKLMNPDEFVVAPARFTFFACDGAERSITLTAGQMAFTLCQTPIVYTRADEPKITVHRAGGEAEVLSGGCLNEIDSGVLFARRGDITRIDVDVVI